MTESRKDGTIAIKTARVIEQGLGRSVRGERDYSVIILTGGDLVKHLRGQESRQYFSDQTRTQIEIGLEAVSLAKQDVESKTKKPLDALLEVAGQCLNRDDGWKGFYVENMNKISGQVNIATKEQAEGSRQIVQAVDNMNRMTQQVSYATAEQKRGGELVVRAMENISEIARDNLSTVEEMSKATANLAQQAENLAKLISVFRVQ